MDKENLTPDEEILIEENETYVEDIVVTPEDNPMVYSDGYVENNNVYTYDGEIQIQAMESNKVSLDSIAGNKGQLSEVEEAVVDAATSTANKGDDNIIADTIHYARTTTQLANLLIGNTEIDGIESDYDNIDPMVLQMLGYDTAKQEKFEDFKDSVSFGGYDEKGSVSYRKFNEFSNMQNTDHTTSFLTTGKCSGYGYNYDAKNLKITVLAPDGSKYEVTSKEYNQGFIRNSVTNQTINLDTCKVLTSKGTVSSLQVNEIFTIDIQKLSEEAAKEKLNNSNLASARSAVEKAEKLAQVSDACVSKLQEMDKIEFSRHVNLKSPDASKQLKSYSRELEAQLKNASPEDALVIEQKMKLADQASKGIDKGNQKHVSKGDKVSQIIDLTGAGNSDVVRGAKMIKGVVRGGQRVHEVVKRRESVVAKNGKVIERAQLRANRVINNSPIAKSSNVVAKGVTKASNSLATYTENVIKERSMRYSKYTQMAEYRKQGREGRYKIKEMKLSDKMEKERTKLAKNEIKQTKLKEKYEKKLSKYEGKRSPYSQTSQNKRHKVNRDGLPVDKNGKPVISKKDIDAYNKGKNKITKKSERKISASQRKKEILERKLNKNATVIEKTRGKYKQGEELLQQAEEKITLRVKTKKFANNIINAVKKVIKDVLTIIAKITLVIPASLICSVCILGMIVLIVGSFFFKFIASVPDSIGGIDSINYNQYIVDRTCTVLGEGFTNVAGRDAYWHYLLGTDAETKKDMNSGNGYYWKKEVTLAKEPFGHIWKREQSDNITKNNDGTFLFNTADSYDISSNNVYVAANNRTELKSINVNIVPIISMANYRFADEINYENYLNVMAYSYYMYANSHDIAKYDSNATDNGYHLKDKDRCNKNSLYYDTTSQWWDSSSKTLQRPTKERCENLYIHGYDIKMGTSVNIAKAKATKFAQGILEWIVGKDGIQSKSLPIGTELVSLNGEGAKFKYCFSGNACGKNVSLGMINGSEAKVTQTNSHIHTYDDGTTYSTESAFVYQKGDGTKYVGCDNITYAQWSTNEKDYIISQCNKMAGDISPTYWDRYNDPTYKVEYPSGSGKKVTFKEKIDTTNKGCVWTATTCGKKSHTSECCCLEHKHDGTEGACDYSHCTDESHHDHKPWHSVNDPGCWTTIAICKGHCGGHAEATVDVSVIDSYKGLMVLDNFKSPKFLTASSFEGFFDLSSKLWDLDMWKLYWKMKANSWFAPFPTSPVNLVEWGLNEAFKGVNNIYSFCVGHIKNWFLGGGDGDAPFDDTGQGLTTAEQSMDDKYGFNGWFSDPNSATIRPEIWEEMMFYYGDEYSQNVGGDWDYAIETWSSVPLWEVFFPFTNNYPYPDKLSFMNYKKDKLEKNKLKDDIKDEPRPYDNNNPDSTKLPRDNNGNNYIY